MGRKINPNGFRLAVHRNWTSQWYAPKRQFADCVHQDYLIRRFIRKQCATAMISKIQITRLSTRSGPTIQIQAARPGMIIGSKGEEIDKLRERIRRITGIADTTVDVKEVRNPDADANLIAQNIASRIEKRQRVRRVIQSAFQAIARQPAIKGAKIRVKGRLDGADIARKDYRHEGRVPLHTLRANIDYGFAEAKTTMGQIGIKVWIFLGEKAVRTKERRHSVLGPGEEGAAETADPAELLAAEEQRRKGEPKAVKEAKAEGGEQEFFDDEDMEGFDAAAKDA
ncbi:MAG: 30S ribosomal protein S3 [Betaproteobacteria bacterium AqS2]|uniref:Small ribosomal subunit protein uS3 n=1 Tax=Candidatus Amphirhobacter heronislandensis TaxID=1732024 RepID=A0A930XYD4_9GAMM|nr:30S ribosomal protein S3 [Betaproteobacteria bacterium AqS2]